MVWQSATPQKLQEMINRRGSKVCGHWVSISGSGSGASLAFQRNGPLTGAGKKGFRTAWAAMAEKAGLPGP